MTKKIDIETMIGGVAAVIAVLAIFVQVWQNSFTQSAIWEGIKDVSTTSVAIIVLVVAVRKFEKKPIETFDRVLKTELERWEELSSPLIHLAKDFPPIKTAMKPQDSINETNESKTAGVVDESEIEVLTKEEQEEDKNANPSTIRYYMLTNFDLSVFSLEGNQEKMMEKRSFRSRTNGRFLQFLNTDSTTLTFYLNPSTFQDRANAELKKKDEKEYSRYKKDQTILDRMNKEDKEIRKEKEKKAVEDTIKKIAPAISAKINSRFKMFAESSIPESGKEIYIKFHNSKLSTPDEARQLVELIKYVMTLYIILA